MNLVFRYVFGFMCIYFIIAFVLIFLIIGSKYNMGFVIMLNLMDSKKCNVPNRTLIILADDFWHMYLFVFNHLQSTIFKLFSLDYTLYILKCHVFLSNY